MLDEPSLGLAPGVVEALYETLDRLHKEGLTLLLAEQSIPLALDIADYAYVLQTGRTVLEGKAVDLEKNEQVQEIYLGIGTRAGAEGAKRSSGTRTRPRRRHFDALPHPPPRCLPPRPPYQSASTAI